MECQELIKKIIHQINEMADATGIVRCAAVVGVYQLVEQLQAAIDRKDEAYQKQIADLQNEIKCLNDLLVMEEKTEENQNGRESE